MSYQHVLIDIIFSSTNFNDPFLFTSNFPCFAYSQSHSLPVFHLLVYPMITIHLYSSLYNFVFSPDFSFGLFLHSLFLRFSLSFSLTSLSPVTSTRYLIIFHILILSLFKSRELSYH